MEEAVHSQDCREVGVVVARGKKRDIVDGKILCPKCSHMVPVEDYLRRTRSYERRGRQYEYVSYEAWCNPCRRAYFQMRSYRLPKETHGSLSNVCEICGSDGSSYKKGLHVDHCHITGLVRGVLCPPCNQRIGRAETLIRDRENLSKSLRYLRRNRSVVVMEPQP
jgi:hypothetical protein